MLSLSEHVFLGGRTIKKTHHDAAGKNILPDATHSTAKKATQIAGESTAFTAVLETVVPFSPTHALYNPLFGSLMSACINKTMASSLSNTSQPQNIQ